jgi:hypothetical protein
MRRCNSGANLTRLGVLHRGPCRGKIAPKRAIGIGGGMVAVCCDGHHDRARAATANLVGRSATTATRAYALRGTSSSRGFGQYERHATSILPVSQVGQYQQAAVGQFQQAAADVLQAAAGEFSSQYGQYFQAQNGDRRILRDVESQGVGSYEPAGQLAMQASAGTNQVIRDGLRPDGDLDAALDVAEAAAGLGEAHLDRVPRTSQWIPNGPLWAGERAVRDTQNTSEFSAGILQRPGGNGILSGG